MANGDDKELVTKIMLNEGVGKLVEEVRSDPKTGIEGLRREMNTRFDKVENRLQRVETELLYVKDEIDGLKANLSTTASRQELEELSN